MGLGGSGDNILVQGNEIAKERLLVRHRRALGGRRIQVRETPISLVVRGNYPHDNHGPGHVDRHQQHPHALDDYLIVHNTHIGIQHEISYDAVIRNNTLIGNGYGDLRGWLWGAEI